MFDSLKNLSSLPGMVAKARELQEKMKALQDDLHQRQTRGEAGGGAITAIVNGRLELMKIRIDREKLGDSTELSALEDLIVVAVHSAQAQAAKTMQDEMSKLAAEVGLPPGLLPS